VSYWADAQQPPRMRQNEQRQWLNVCVHESHILRWIAHTSVAPSPNEEITVGAHRHFIRVWFTMSDLCALG